MDKNDFCRRIDDYLMTHNWQSRTVNGDIYYAKSFDKITIPHKNKFLSLHFITRSLREKLSLNGRADMHFDTVINPYDDTDYIIACLQVINPFLRGDQVFQRARYYSFQPVIRSVPTEFIGKAGFLKSFVNVGTVTIMAELVDYFEEFELWITALSSCSIHASTIKLKLKHKTNSYDGVGLKICVGEEEIGQFNYYIIDSKDESVGVTDFGLGLERICWAANGFQYFDLTCQSAVDYYLNNRELTEDINLVVLLILSGVRPNSSRFGLRLRKVMTELLAKRVGWDYSGSIVYAYDYWTSFLQTSLSLLDVKNVFYKEMSYQMNRYIASTLNYDASDRLLKQDVSKFTSSMIFNHILKNDD